MMHSILSNGVWTPNRAKRANAGSGDCIHCGLNNADVYHLWWNCPKINRYPKKKKDAVYIQWGTGGRPLNFDELIHIKKDLEQIKSLWTTGVVPADFITPYLSPFIVIRDELWNSIPLKSTKVTDVFTDGSGTLHTGNHRAGFGVHFPEFGHKDFSGPITGPSQSVPRAEVMALVHATAMTENPIHVHSDNAYVVRTLNDIIKGNDKQRLFHEDLWKFINQNTHKINRVPGTRNINGSETTGLTP